MATILVVEDYPVTQRVLAQQLRKAGHAVTTASNGLEALDLLAEEWPDLLIVDIAMPEMDGISLLKHLSEREGYADLPVIVLTASGQDHDRQVVRQLGAGAFLNKPASSRELINTVNQLLE